MLSFDDDRWNHLKGGYKSPFDPRSALQEIERQTDSAEAWHELWEELHHQGDVGDASYAAVPELVRIHRAGEAVNWNLYGLVATIELARTEPHNPDLPDWLRTEYFRSIRELAQMGREDIALAEKPETVRAILSIIAIERNLRNHGRFLLDYSEDELADFRP